MGSSSLNALISTYQNVPVTIESHNFATYYIALAHDALLARIESELEDPLNDDAVVNSHGSVKRGFHARTEVNHADYGSVWVVEWGLICFGKQ